MLMLAGMLGNMQSLMFYDFISVDVSNLVKLVVTQTFAQKLMGDNCFGSMNNSMEILYGRGCEATKNFRAIYH